MTATEIDEITPEHGWTRVIYFAEAMNSTGAVNLTEDVE
jgi:hypothetical protein